MDQMRMREAHDSMDLLRIHLEQSSKRARERAKEPDRVAAAAELTGLHDRLNIEVKLIQDIHFARFGARLEELRIREMELCYDLDQDSWKHILLLKEARTKEYKARENYKEMKDKELDKYRKEVYVCVSVCVCVSACLRVCVHTCVCVFILHVHCM